MMEMYGITGSLVYWEGCIERGAKNNAEREDDAPITVWAMAPYFKVLNIGGPIV